jgi:hypothetical protein
MLITPFNTYDKPEYLMPQDFDTDCAIDGPMVEVSITKSNIGKKPKNANLPDVLHLAMQRIIRIWLRP